MAKIVNQADSADLGVGWQPARGASSEVTEVASAEAEAIATGTGSQEGNRLKRLVAKLTHFGCWE